MYEGHAKSMMMPHIVLLLMSCFAYLWAGLSTTRVFNLGPVYTKQIPQDGGSGGGRGVSDAKVNIVLEFCVSE